MFSVYFMYEMGGRVIVRKRSFRGDSESIIYRSFNALQIYIIFIYRKFLSYFFCFSKLMSCDFANNGYEKISLISLNDHFLI